MLIGMLIGVTACLGLSLSVGSSCRSCRGGFDFNSLIPLLIALAVIVLIVSFFRWLDKK